MGSDLGGRLRAEAEEKRRWFEARARDVAQDAGLLDAKAREVYANAIRTGQRVVAATPSQVRELGLAAVTGRLPQALGGMAAREVVKAQRASAPREPSQARLTSAKPATPTGFAENAYQQARAGVSGAVDEVSFGLADRGLAAVEALYDGGLDGFGKRYDEGMAEKRAEDAFDADNYWGARNVGRAVGVVGSLAAMGPAAAAGRLALRAAVPGGRRLVALAAKAPRVNLGIDPRGLARLSAAGGATSGVVGQVAGDVLSGRVSSVGDYLGAAGGGAVGGVATLRGGAVRGGLVGGALTSAAQDVLNGRAPSVENAIEAAHVGAVMSGVLGGVGTHAAAALPSNLKGNLGELMSEAKLRVRGERGVHRHEPHGVGRGRHSKPDFTVNFGEPSMYFQEAKLGPYANLTTNQKALRAQNRDRFFVDHWQFSDVGKAASVGGLPVGTQLTDQERFPWRAR